MRIKKLTGSGIIGKAARHNKRTIQAEIGASASIDPTRSHLNETLVGPLTPDAVAQLAKDLMAAAGLASLRKDAVLGLELVFSLPMAHGLNELLALRKAVTAHRSEIAALKRQVKALASAVKVGVRTSRAHGQEASAPSTAAAPSIRFSTERFAALRAKLGLTQAQMANLLGVSYLSVHKWEGGKAQPRAAQLQKIASVMKIGKREAMRQLQA